MSRYAVADLHGQLDLFNQIKEYINDDDIVYALGDFGDRGPEPWRTLKSVLDDPQFKYLMGNHDLMLIEAIDEYVRAVEIDGYCDLWRHVYNPNGRIGLLVQNGGLQTLEQWVTEENRMNYYWKLRTLPLEIRLAALNGKHFIYLTHSGCVPDVDIYNNVEDFVWDRLHFCNQCRDNFHGDISIEGHTSQEFVKKKIDSFMTTKVAGARLYEEKDGCLYYCNGHKINIDRGAYYTNETVLLNIDTLESKIFKVRENVNGS